MSRIPKFVDLSGEECLASKQEMAWDAQHKREDSLRAELHAMRRDIEEVHLLRRENQELQRYTSYLADQLVSARQELHRLQMRSLAHEIELA